jgi:hypothetical protein
MSSLSFRRLIANVPCVLMGEREADGGRLEVLLMINKEHYSEIVIAGNANYSSLLFPATLPCFQVCCSRF